MAKPAKNSRPTDGEDRRSPIRDVCGIVMPISDTPNHSDLHWSRVQTLLHRAIEQAGLEPKNVWAGEATDRITERILSNLFDVPIAVCDVSDLNPNVMLELGMRLTSKKPTIVVVEKGGVIPFDIGDFEAVEYPGDLNMIDMETFFERLGAQLTEKLAGWKAHTYRPFLSNVTIDVLEPEARQVPFEELVTQQLEAIMARMEQLDSRTSWVSRRARLLETDPLPTQESPLTPESVAAGGDLVFIRMNTPDEREKLEVWLSTHPDVSAWGRAAGAMTYHVRLNKPLNPTLLTQLHADLRAAGITPRVTR